MQAIKLPAGVFKYDPDKPLGRRGGFGQVFLGQSTGGIEVAVKRLHVSATDAAHRELRIAVELQGRFFEHVVPFIDSGQDAETCEYFVVMPKAKYSLQNLIDEKGPLAPDETASVLLQIAKGLLEVGELVHRDLKPDNVLYHDGKWKIADFGIARFVEEATASNTLKECLSPYYAAPEQWRGERATHATDVYSLGCVAFCLLTGKPPFVKEPKNEHLNAPLPSFNCSDPRLITLVNMCLRKAPEARPSIGRVLTVLTPIATEPYSSQGAISPSALAKAAAFVSENTLAAEARHAAIQAENDRRIAHAKSAYEGLCEIIERLEIKVLSQASNAISTGTDRYARLVLRLGPGELSLGFDRQVISKGSFPHSGWDVVAYAIIGVDQQRPKYEWTATLWYARLKGSTDYRWYEASYMSCLGRRSGQFEPFALHPGEDADMAASNIVCGHSFAFGPVAIDDEEESAFHKRWCWLLAKAAEGVLGRPSRMPIEWPPDMLRS